MHNKEKTQWFVDVDDDNDKAWNSLLPLACVALVKGPCARYVTAEPCQLPMFYFAMQIPHVPVYRLFVEYTICVAVKRNEIRFPAPIIITICFETSLFNQIPMPSLCFGSSYLLSKDARRM